jgi:hypothetical protein
MWEQLFGDLRFAFRTCRKNIGFSAAVILIVSVAVGASGAIFSIYNAVLLRPLPYRDANRIVIAWEKRAKEGSRENGVTPADCLDLAGAEPHFLELRGAR